MENKEIKDLRRDAVTRIRRVATIEVSYITKEGQGKSLERFVKPYTDAADLRKKLVARMAREEKLLTDMKIVEELTALYGMEEDEFFQKAKVLKVLEEKKGE